MKPQEIERIVTAVIARLASRLGADGSRGLLLAVFSGATAGFNEAVQQVRLLVLDGYRIQLAFSQAAEELYGQLVRERLAGFPHTGAVDATNWLAALKDARAVLVPLLSVNTVSKLSQLIADNLATNLLLHALFMGKPVIVASNGADPAGKERRELNFHRGSPPLNRALLQRLRTVADYGCHLTDVEQIREATNSLITPESDLKPKPAETQAHAAGSGQVPSARVITATDVLQAHRLGVSVRLRPGSLTTPLAQDLAEKHGVALVEG
jgi:hypothetical protein